MNKDLGNSVFMKSDIKYLLMDVDGTLTDGKIYMGNGGEVFKAFSIKDGYGIHDLLMPRDILPVIITGRTSKIIENRCAELGITELYQGIYDKIHKMSEVIERMKCDFFNIAYIGDDLNDFECMKVVKENGGIVACPADAATQVREISDFISSKAGGDGAVREFIEWLVV